MMTTPLMLVSARYDGLENKIVLKFYDIENHKIVDWIDNTNHMPYCYSKTEDLDELLLRDDVLEVKKEKKFDILVDKEIDVSKIVTTNPLAIGGSSGAVRDRVETWESDIKYHQSYLFDRQLVMGSYYIIEDNKVIPYEMKIPEKVKVELDKMWSKTTDEHMVDKEEFKEHVKKWANLLNQPIPRIKRIAVDIEVESFGALPDSRKAEERITAIGLDGTDDHEIYVLKRNVEDGENVLPDMVKVVFFDDEKKMIEQAFSLMKEYPFVLTFNGDDFDMPFLYNRAKKLGILDKDNLLKPLKDSATLKDGLHLDLFQIFKNRALQIYAFQAKYSEYGLNAISTALLGETKIDHGKEINSLNHYEIANYCWNDSRLTLKLTTYDDDMLMNLLILICRISRMTIDELNRVRISQWIKNLLYYEHRKKNHLIPKLVEFDARGKGTTTKAVIEGKKYRGAVVLEPQAGVHFGVKVMDFASLYPTIIKVRNISYESVRCTHEECKTNTLEGTDHWSCIKKNGMLSLIIGSLRDLRVNYYRVLSLDNTLPKKDRNQYKIIREVLKVFLNASYGVTGAETFPLFFLPTAESITSIARHIILETADECKAQGINLLYGDTDSLFTKQPTDEQLKTVVEGAKKKHGVELEIDKEYRYVVLSGRKKNYFGVLKSGKIVVTGLTGKKSHTPEFIKNLFKEMKEILGKVETPEQFEVAKDEISKKVGEWGNRLENRQIPLDQLCFKIMLSKDTNEYVKVMPQHIRAVKMLEVIRKVNKGEIIAYIKTDTREGVKPLELALPHEVDVKKYREFMERTLEQIIEPMNLNFDRMMGKPAQVSLDSYFG